MREKTELQKLRMCDKEGTQSEVAIIGEYVIP